MRWTAKASAVPRAAELAFQSNPGRSDHAAWMYLFGMGRPCFEARTQYFSRSASAARILPSPEGFNDEDRIKYPPRYPRPFMSRPRNFTGCRIVVAHPKYSRAPEKRPMLSDLLESTAIEKGDETDRLGKGGGKRATAGRSRTEAPFISIDRHGEAGRYQ